MIPRTVGAHKPIPVVQLKQHGDRYHAYDDALFNEEFKVIMMMMITIMMLVDGNNDDKLLLHAFDFITQCLHDYIR